MIVLEHWKFVIISTRDCWQFLCFVCVFMNSRMGECTDVFREISFDRIPEVLNTLRKDFPQSIHVSRKCTVTDF